MNKHTYTSKILSATLLLSTPLMVNAEEQSKADSAKKIEAVSAEELASRKASIPLIEERIKDREEQINVIVADIKRLSSRIESRVEKIVATLEKMKDSEESKVRVAQMKQDVMKGLYSTVENYNRRRAELKEQLRTGKAAVGEESATKGVELFDKKIEKRAEQMVTLSKSFTEHVDYQKYENDSSGGDYGYGGRRGWGYDNTRTSEKWKQNRRETTQTDKQRKKMIEALKTSIDNLERRNNTLSNKAKEGGVSKETQKFYQEDIARNEAAISERTKQLGGLMQPGSGSTATTSVSRNQAHDTELLIREVANDIRRDSGAVTRNYNTLKQRLASYNRIKVNLEARKKWLEQYEAQHGSESK